VPLSVRQGGIHIKGGGVKIEGSPRRLAETLALRNQESKDGVESSPAGGGYNTTETMEMNPR